MLFTEDVTCDTSGKNLENLFLTVDDIDDMAEIWYTDNNLKLNRVKTKKLSITVIYKMVFCKIVNLMVLLCGVIQARL